jgi:peptidoglycan hydrolase-like protein with peptidoglycan-binding domain
MWKTFYLPIHNGETGPHMSFVIQNRDAGVDVRRLQELLNSQASAGLSPDGNFGPHTRNALIAWQRSRGLVPSGVVDQATLDGLAIAGLVLLGPHSPSAQPGANWPPRPAAPPQPTPSYTAQIFGTFKFRAAPEPGNPEAIEILDGWREQNIVTIPIPELDNCLFAVGNGYVLQPIGRITCHRLAVPKFQKLFSEWRSANLIDRVITCAGAFNARLKRGATNPIPANLSNHSWGTALDINDEQNPRSHVPVTLGSRGCVRELVEIANSLGFYWGGHFENPPDGMHFELSVV